MGWCKAEAVKVRRKSSVANGTLSNKWRQEEGQARWNVVAGVKSRSVWEMEGVWKMQIVEI